MKIYCWFNTLSRPRTYAGRILLICFIGIHIPLIAFTLWAVLSRSSLEASDWLNLLVLLLATLIGTALTLVLVHGMLAPVRVTAHALAAYRQHRQMPNLPRDLSDEAGHMLAQVQDTLEELNLSLANLARAAETDPLTGIGNRRWLITQGQEQMARAQRGQFLLSAILFDLDRFKAINDQYGHAKGDAVLVEVARFVKGQLRSSHLFGRLGGEEFGIILPKTSLEEAVALATRIQNSLSIQSVGQLRTGAVTASFGVTEWQAEDKELSSLLRRADDLLYQAKRDGRNQVVAADADA